MEDVKLAEMPGAFVEALTRKNSQIKTDRAIAIAEDLELIMKREVEDLETQLKRTRRDRESMLDLSPSNSMSLMVASDFDAKVFTSKYLELGLAIRNLEIRLEIAKNSYNYLFTTKTAQ